MEDKEMKEMVEDTHRMVKKLYKFEKNRRFFRVLKTILIIVIIVGAYYAILPFFNNILNTYNDVSQGITNVQSFQFPGFGNQE